MYRHAEGAAEAVLERVTRREEDERVCEDRGAYIVDKLAQRDADSDESGGNKRKGRGDSPGDQGRVLKCGVVDARYAEETGREMAGEDREERRKEGLRATTTGTAARQQLGYRKPTVTAFQCDNNLAEHTSALG